LVVLDHTFGWPSGGFLGVDVFFVISGFLISGILIREIESNGSISFRAFYARRARRILPAALVVLFTTVIVASLLWFPPRAVQVAVDAVWSALFASNWHFAASDSDCFATEAPSPLLHYWSLAVEEQFYALWPLVILLVAPFAARLGLRVRHIVGVVAAILVLVSLGWAAWRTASSTDAAYFDTFARAWELLAGAALAAVGSNALTGRARHVISTLGLVIILASAILIRGDGGGIPFPWVTPTVAGAMLVIWANARAGRLSILGNPISQWLGDTSYSLYLWHFPVIVFAVSVFGGSVLVRAATIPLMLAIAALSRRWIEEPFMHRKRASKSTLAPNKPPLVVRDLMVGVGVIVAILSFSAVALEGPRGMHDANSVISRLPAVGGGPIAISSNDQSQRSREVRAALGAAEWPSLMSATGVWELALSGSGRDCMNNPMVASSPKWCGDPKSADILVVGDSVAMSWLPAIEEAVADTGWSAAGTGYTGCQLSGGLKYNSPTYGPEFAERCATVQDETLHAIKDLDPKLLVLTGHPGALSRMNSTVSTAAQTWQDAFTRMLGELSTVEHVVVLEANPWNEGLAACLVRTSAPSTCASEVDDWHAAKASAEAASVATVTNASYVPTAAWFCFESTCPVFVAGFPVTTDGVPLTAPEASAVSSLLREALAPITR